MYLSEDQFNKLVELLTPGYELAKAYMAEIAARTPPVAEMPTEPTEPPHDADEPPAT